MQRIRIIADKGREAPIAHLERLATVAVQQIQMTTGDYAIVDAETDQIKVVIERKTWPDLAATLRTPSRKANHQKLLQLREETGCTVVYMIEGKAFPASTRKIGRIPVKSLVAHLDHVMIRDGCHVIQTRDAENTAERILALARNTTTIEGFYPPVVDGGDDVVESELLTRRIRKTTEAIWADVWCTMHSITTNTYLVLVNAGLGLGDIVGGVAEVDVIAELQFPSGTRIGSTRARKITGVVNQENADVHTKMLAAITGVTKPVAQKILEVFPIFDIIAGEVQPSELAEIRRNGNRRLGLAVANRIVEVLTFTPSPRHRHGGADPQADPPSGQ